TFTIIDNDLSDRVVGEFGAVGLSVGLPVPLRLDINGSHGNDVVLTHVNTATAAEDLALTPRVIQKGQTVTLSGRLTDPDLNDHLTLQVDWGDGSRVETFHPGREPFALKHRYRASGRHTVHLTWFDEHGAGNSRDLHLKVRNA